MSTDDAATANVIHELRDMIEVLTRRLENAVTYKGDESSEWSYKEEDKFWIERARDVLYPNRTKVPR